MTTSHTELPEDGRIFIVDAVDVRLEAGRHSVQAAAESEIAANWQREIAANPALFNGEIVLQEEVTLTDGRLTARARMTDFATLLWWRRQPEPSGGQMLVASAVPLSSDGAAIAIRMAPHTANAGRVYFAAGSLDRSDVNPDGSVDALGSMGRELFEETGLKTDDAVADPVLYGTRAGRWVYVFRIFRFPWTADEICARVRQHIAEDPDPEIDAVYALREAELSAFPYDRLARIVLPEIFSAGQETEQTAAASA